MPFCTQTLLSLGCLGQADIPLADRGGALLSIYTTALETHARCVGVNPSITPLVTTSAPNNSPQGLPQTTEGSFFRPLEQAGLRVPGLLEVGRAGFGREAARKPGACGPRIQWARAVLYALEVQRESVLQRRFTCDADMELPAGDDALPLKGFE